jgi:transketolase C-terminal domain/subunit
VRENGGHLFQALGFRYFGPVDGNDVAQVIDTLKKLKEIGGPVLLHALTKKGKGYAPAEANQTVWHAPGLFDMETGERIQENKGVSRYQDVFGKVLLDLARQNDKVVGITPAMASGCGMNILAKEMPERFYDVGIEEEHAITFSAGLAAGGMKPFCNIYSSFSQRSYDQIIHDVALQELPVVICLDRGGLVGEDGATHHGCYDMSIFRSIPGAVIAAPKDELELKNMMYSAMIAQKGPYIIRYPRGFGEGVEWESAQYTTIPSGKGEKMADGTKVAVIAAGPFVYRALEAAAELRSETGWSPSIYNIRYIKPIDVDILSEVYAGYDRVITIEDSAELVISHIENKVQMECRAANSIGKGEVSMTQLIRTSLRMRPDRIIVGEVRGKEVVDMIQAMNTGHDGSMSTGHGNSIKGMLNRLETMYLTDSQVSVDSVRNQIANAIDIFVHLRRDAKGRRYVEEVAEMTDYDGKEYKLNYLYKAGEDGILASTGNGLCDRERLIRCGYDAMMTGIKSA